MYVQNIIFRLMCHVSAQGIDEHMIHVHYYYYLMFLCLILRRG